MRPAKMPDWWESIQRWRRRKVPTLSNPLLETLAKELQDLTPGQLIIAKSKLNGREYAILEMEELEALLKRAGMVQRDAG